MPTSTRTKLQVVNSVLNSVGERGLGASSTQIGSIVVDCIREAILDVSTGASWNELRDIIGGTWSTDVCTLSDNVYKISGVLYERTHSPTPAWFPVHFCTLETYLMYPLTGYSTGNYPQVWVQTGSNEIRVNPYPTSVVEKSYINVEVYKYPPVPVNDTDYFACSDQFLNLIQYKASSLFALKYLSDPSGYKAFDMEFEKLRRKQLVYATGLPSGGYTMYRGRRSHGQA
jgi:hypothetical protein